MTFVPPPHWQSRPSPNYNARTRQPTGIILHADASNNVASSLDWCRRAESKVSYHVLIGRKGDIYLLVSPDQRAWHAGESLWDGAKDCNSCTIGVCLSNRNDGTESYPAAQRLAARDVCVALMRHYRIPIHRITTHAAVATPPGRKTDPKGFDIPSFQSSVAPLLFP